MIKWDNQFQLLSKNILISLFLLNKELFNKYKKMDLIHLVIIFIN